MIEALKRNHIYTGDALEVAKTLPDGCVDLVVTSPPYNIRNSTGGGFRSTETRPGKWRAELRNGYDGHEDAIPHEEYVAYHRLVMIELMRLIKMNGAIFYNHKWRVQNGLIQKLGDQITEGFPVRQIIIWDRGSGMNFNDGYFVPTYEVIYLIAKPDFVLRKAVNGLGDVWRILPAKNNPHPAPFPVEIPRRCIRSTDANIVLDPFMGSGSTAIAADSLGVQWIGIEKSPKYVAMALRRLAGNPTSKQGKVLEDVEAEDKPKTLNMFGEGE